MAEVLTTLRRLKDDCLHAFSSRLIHWTKPLTSSLPLTTLTDLGRSKSELIAENALLRQQRIILKRQVKRPPVTKADRILVLATCDVCSGNGDIARDRTRLLAQTREMRVQSTPSILLVLVFPGAYFHEGEVSISWVVYSRR